MKAQPEFELQKLIAEYLRKAYPNVYFLSDVRASLRLTIPQQVRAKAIQAADFACPDLVIFEAKKSPFGLNTIYIGMFLELKAESPLKKDGTLKKNEHLERQQSTIDRLRQKGYHADFYWEFDEARANIDWYLRGDK